MGNINTLSIKNNTVVTSAQAVTINTVEGLEFENNLGLKSAISVVEIRNAKDVTITGNTIVGGTIGFLLENTERGVVRRNKLDSLSDKGLDLISTEEIYISQNTANRNQNTHNTNTFNTHTMSPPLMPL